MHNILTSIMDNKIVQGIAVLFREGARRPGGRTFYPSALADAAASGRYTVFKSYAPTCRDMFCGSHISSIFRKERRRILVLVKQEIISFVLLNALTCNS